MKRIILPLIAILFFVSESIFANVFSGGLFGSERIFVPRFILIFLSFLTIYGSRKNGLIYGFILGLMYDVVYTEVLGIYMFLFGFVVYVIYQLMRILQNNSFIVYSLTLLMIAVLEIIVFEINVFLHFAQISFLQFSEERLYPSLILNLAVMIIISFPLKRLVENYGKTEAEE